MATNRSDKAVWTLAGESRRESLRRMFAAIAGRYDALNAIMSGFRHRRWRAEAVQMLALPPGSSALDLCCGTGDFMLPLRNAVGSNGRLIGIDFCEPMLQLARRKLGPGSPLVLGDACRIPLSAAVLEAVTIGWGVRNVIDRPALFAEINRVLRPGGQVCIVEMNPAPRGVLGRVGSRIFGWLAPRLGAAAGQRAAYEYLPRSIEGFATSEALGRELAAAGFTCVQFRDRCFGCLTICTAVRL